MPSPEPQLPDKCPGGCGSSLYGDHHEPAVYKCGSGYMTDENRSDEFVRTTACATIAAMRPVVEAAEAWRDAEIAGEVTAYVAEPFAGLADAVDAYREATRG